MKFKGIFLIAGIFLMFLVWAGVLSISILWGIPCIVMWIMFTYISVHNQNKLRNTPKPVYLT